MAQAPPSGSTREFVIGPRPRSGDQGDEDLLRNITDL
jgi:hypothetical protein